MNLLLVGYGFLGQALAQVAQRRGMEVTPISLHGGDGALACDVGDAAAVANLSAVPDGIIHCAASGRGGVDAYRHVYVDGCRNLIASFPGVPMVFTSSTSVYAQSNGDWVTEDSLADPLRETGRLLREAEELTLAAGGTVARLAGLYGPGRSVILQKFLTGEAVIEDDGRRYLNQIHRDDAARALLHLLERRLGPAIFNVCDSQPLSQRDCYQALARELGRPLPRTGPRDFGRKRAWTHKRVSNAKLRASGWNPEFPVFLDALPGLLAQM